MNTLGVIVLVLAALPAILYTINLLFYRSPRRVNDRLPAVSILIPARNEERSIGPALEAALASTGITIEVIVLDDHSSDATADIVRDFAQRDPRVRLETAPALPAGWCGKQHACFALSRLATYDHFCFVDADVRLAPDGIARLVGFMQARRADLVSGIPRQETGTILEKMVIPLIHFVLLGYLPMIGMRFSRWTSFAAGCGQLFLTDRAAYDQIGGHAAVKGSLHDGITLPKAYRQSGLRTDMCDATALAVCRMYRSAGELWYGLAKNAREGMAAPALIIPFTILLFGGQVLPLVLLFDESTRMLGAIACACVFLPRFDAAWRFQQSWLGACLQPIGVLALLAIQWYATVRVWIGRPVGWKGRAHPSTQETPA